VTTPVRFSQRSLADRDRIFEFLAETNPGAADRAIKALVKALDDIAVFPDIGRPGPQGYRKLVVTFGKAGYEIRYRRYADRVIVTRIFHTREDR
jgi:toxin ParE1/3/4